MATVAQKQAWVVERLGGEADPRRRLDALLDLACPAEKLPASLRTGEHLVEGCLAELWVVPSFRAGRCFFRCDSDSRIVRGVAGVLCWVYDGAEPAAILAHPPHFLREAGVTEHLTANRRNALTRVWSLIRDFARQCGALPSESDA